MQEYPLEGWKDGKRKEERKKGEGKDRLSGER
jgi:hypothetical protein